MKQSLFILFCLLLQVNSGHVLEKDCQEMKRGTLLCNNAIPENISEGIEHVKIFSIVPKETRIKNESFNGHNWSRVKSLWVETVEQIESYIPKLILYNNTFSNLCSLESLTVSMPALEEIEADAFRGLDNLTDMSFVAIRRTSVFYLILVLENKESMPNLQTLKINLMNTYAKPPTTSTSLDSIFFHALALRNITELHITQTPIDVFDFKASMVMCDRIRLVNATRTTIHRNKNRTSTPCSSLKTVILKKFTKSSKSTHLYYKNVDFKWKLYDRYYFFKNALKLNIDFWWADLSTIINTCLDIESQEFQLKEISMQNNKLNHIDLVLVTKAFVNLEKLEMQSNVLSYLSGGSFMSLPSLKTLNLSDNLLGRMQSMNTSSFAKMLSHLKSLKILDLSRNGLTYIPKNSFVNNTKLLKLSLRNNNIEQIAFQASVSMSFIDLSYNKISYLDKVSRQWFEQNFRLHLNKSKFNVDIGNNPFQCVCKYVEFLQWYVQSSLVKNSSNEVACIDHEHEEITLQLSNDLKEECERPIIIRNVVLSSSAGFVVTAVVITTVIIACRRYRKRVARERTIDEIIGQIQDGAYRFAFPVFLSYCNEDCDTVMEYIYQPLVDALRNILDTPNELVCIGDRHFTPGRSILEEIQRCLENSALVIFVMSNAFSESLYCKIEIEEAYLLNKPSLLIFVEEVDENNMLPVMRQQFRRYVRVNMRNVNGEFQIVPSWERICQSILEMLPR